MRFTGFHNLSRFLQKHAKTRKNTQKHAKTRKNTQKAVPNYSTGKLGVRDQHAISPSKVF
jgi:UTP:GlnB (protein PII) uridylyltransferase